MAVSDTRVKVEKDGLYLLSAGIPFYDGDLEAEGIPEIVVQPKHQVAGCDALLLATPENNNSIRGVFKNTIDWLSRPADGLGNVFRDKPVALMGASPGGFGTILSQNAWLPVFRTLAARHWTGGRLLVSGAGRVFDEDGTLADEAIRERLEHFLTGFVGFAGL